MDDHVFGGLFLELFHLFQSSEEVSLSIDVELIWIATFLVSATLYQEAVIYVSYWAVVAKVTLGKSMDLLFFVVS